MTLSFSLFFSLNLSLERENTRYKSMLETTCRTKNAKNEMRALIDPNITRIMALIINPQKPSRVLVLLKLAVKLTELVTAT